MSSFPSGITLRTVTYTGVGQPGVGDEQIIEIDAIPMTALIWKANRWQMPAHGWSVRGFDTASLQLPVTSQSGYQLPSGKDAGSPSTQYWIRVRVYYGAYLVNEVSKIVPLPAEDLSPVDLDTMLPVGTVAGGAVLVPDSWSARLDALEAGGVGSVVGVTFDDTPAAPAEGESASYLVSSAVTWPAGLVWSTDPDGGTAPTITGTALVSMFTVGGVTRAIMGATFPAPPAPADTTAPSIPAGLSATATSSTTVDLAWTASTDDTAVTGYEYRVNGGTAVDAGAGLAETVAGLTASTLYSFEVRAYDAAGNRSDWSTAASATTSAPPADSTPPTVGTMAASSITETGFTLTVSGASDTVALHATPYAFTTNGGSTWSAYQASPVYVASGLTASTGYSCNWRVRDAAGNVSTGTSQTVTTTTTTAAAIPVATTLASIATAPQYRFDLTDAAGATAAVNSGSAGGSLTALSGNTNAGASGTNYMFGETPGLGGATTSFKAITNMTGFNAPVDVIDGDTVFSLFGCFYSGDYPTNTLGLFGKNTDWYLGVQHNALQATNGGNNLVFSMGTVSISTTGHLFTPKQKHGIAVTCDGSTLRMYLDGSLIASAETGGASISTAKSSWFTGVGRIYGSPSPGSVIGNVGSFENYLCVWSGYCVPDDKAKALTLGGTL